MVLARRLCFKELLFELCGNKDGRLASFHLLPNSKLSYHDAFRANQFIAGGIRPIYRFSKCSTFAVNSMASMPIRFILLSATITTKHIMAIHSVVLNIWVKHR
jgi:hypothetical protein